MSGPPPARTLIPRLDSLGGFRPFEGPVDLRDRHYLAATGFVGILGLLPALAFLFMWLGFGAWGWVKRMGGGVCCAPNLKGYTAREKLMPKLASYVTTGLFLGGAGLIFFAGYRLMKGGNGVQEALNARSSELLDATQFTIEGLRGARSSFFDQDFVNNLGRLGLDFRNGVEAVLGTTSRTAKTVGDGIYFGETAIMGATVMLCLLSLMNCIATCLRLSRMLFLLLGFGVVMCFVCWLCFGAVFVLDVVFRDICLLVREADPGRRVSQLAPLAPCATGAVGPLLNETRYAVEMISEGLNGQMVDALLNERYGDFRELCTPVQLDEGTGAYVTRDCVDLPTVADFARPAPKGYSSYICGSPDAQLDCTPVRSWDDMKIDADAAVALLSTSEVQQGPFECADIQKMAATVDSDFCSTGLQLSVLLCCGFLALCLAFSLLMALHLLNALREDKPPGFKRSFARSVAMSTLSGTRPGKSRGSVALPTGSSLAQV